MNTQRRLTQRESCNMQQVEVTEWNSEQNFISVEFMWEIKHPGLVPLAEQETLCMTNMFPPVGTFTVLLLDS